MRDLLDGVGDEDGGGGVVEKGWVWGRVAKVFEQPLKLQL